MNDSSRQPGVVEPPQRGRGTIGARWRQGCDADSASIAAVDTAAILARLRAERDAARRWPMPWVFAVPFLQLAALAWLRADGSAGLPLPATVLAAGVGTFEALVLAVGTAVQGWWQAVSAAAVDALPPSGMVTAMLVLGAAIALAAATAVEEHQERNHAAIN